MRKITAAIALLLLIGLTGCTSAAAGDASSVMLHSCESKVATWSKTSRSSVTGHEVNEATQNPSGKAWDFYGTYMGGNWKCGGAAHAAHPATVVVFPTAGSEQDILEDSTPPQSASTSPAAEVEALEAAARAPTSTCLGAVAKYASVPETASDAVVNAAAKVTVERCGTVGQYVRASKDYPNPAGVVDASYIDGQTALDVIQAICYDDHSAAVCKDAAAHHLL